MVYRVLKFLQQLPQGRVAVVLLSQLVAQHAHVAPLVHIQVQERLLLLVCLVVGHDELRGLLGVVVEHEHVKNDLMALVAGALCHSPPYPTPSNRNDKYLARLLPSLDVWLDGDPPQHLRVRSLLLEIFNPILDGDLRFLLAYLAALLPLVSLALLMAIYSAILAGMSELWPFFIQQL